jgi:hypothetical protein
MLAASVTAAVAAGALPAQPDRATATEDIASSLDRTGSHVDPGAPVDAQRVATVAEEIARQGDRWGLVVLDAPPDGGATVAADLLLDDLSRRGSQVDTVVVLVFDGAARDVGTVSEVHGDATLSRGLDRAVDELRRDPARGFAAMYSAVTGSRLAGLPEDMRDAADIGTGAPSGALLVGGLMVGLVGGALFLMWRGQVTARRRLADRLETSRDEIRSQLSAVADSILALDDRVTLAGPEIRERFASVNQTYSEVRERVDGATIPVELEALEDRMDDARWEVASIEALLDGRPEPQRPLDQPGACFFDPTHGAGTERVQLQTALGERPVGVCRTCAEALARGEQPPTRTIDVGGRSVPAAAAPRSAGGGGLDLGDVLQLVVGGVVLGGFGRGRRRSHWGGGYGGFGGGFGGGLGGVGGGRGAAGRGLGGGRGMAGRGFGGGRGRAGRRF